MFDALTAKQTMGDGDTLLCLISALISLGSLIKKFPQYVTANSISHKQLIQLNQITSGLSI